MPRKNKYQISREEFEAITSRAEGINNGNGSYLLQVKEDIMNLLGYIEYLQYVIELRDKNV